MEEIHHAAHRPDLPDCPTCDNGTACQCTVLNRKGQETGWCGCMGFLSCPDCPREMSGMIAMSLQPEVESSHDG